MIFNFREFHKNLQKDFAEAASLISDIDHFRTYGQKEKFHADEENELNELQLIEVLNQIKLKLEFSYEYLGLTRMYESLRNELQEYEEKFNLLKYIPYVDIPYSPVQWILKTHFNALTCHVQIESDSEYENSNNKLILEQILRGTPKILLDRKIEPSNEADVRNAVYKTLIHVFPDTVREIPIAKVSKTYKPDIGVKRIKSAIEYKFVDSEKEAKTALGGIFEDINGYEGSNDWTTFYAVIYMTDNFLTQDQVEAEFKLSKVPHHWKPIVVFGKGERKKK